MRDRHVHPAPNVPSKLEELRSYSGYHRRRVRVYEPHDVDEVVAVVRHFAATGTPFSIMGAGLSFGGHFMSEAAVISMARLDRIRLRLDENLITVQPGARWGDIVRLLLARGFVAPVAPTTSMATAGGTVSADTYCRFSTHFGKEAESIASLVVLLATGEVRRCSRTESPELFAGVITGFGLLGVVLEITYRVHHVGAHPAMYSEGTIVEGIADPSFLRADDVSERFGDRRFMGSAGALYWRRGVLRNVVWKFTWVDDPGPRRPCAVHVAHPLRVVGDFAARFWPRLAVEAWNVYHRQCRRARPHNLSFLDDAWPATFFMDNNVKSRAMALRLGVDLSLLQQSFAVPCLGDRAADAARFRRFVRHALEDMRSRGLTPAMVDQQFLPQGTTTALTSNPGQDAYLLSFAFEGRGITSRADVAGFFASLSWHLHLHYEGRVHLTKNVCAPPELMRAMYEPQLAILRRQKAVYDPRGLLINDHLAGLFPSLFEGAGQPLRRRSTIAA